MIKPTSYHGITFRSKLESLWAVFFDAHKIKWQYEPESVTLPSGEYIPDFWLPELEMWVEVKGAITSSKAVNRIAELAHKTGYSVLLLEGNVKSRGHTKFKSCMDMEDPSALYLGVVMESYSFAKRGE